MNNPYRWQHDDPEHRVYRPHLLEAMVANLRDGRAVKLVGGRGMGKSVLLRQLQESFDSDPETRVVRVPGPTAEPTLTALVHDLAHRIGLARLERASMDLVMELLDRQGVNRLVVLLDEIDQYVILDGQGKLARAWLNYLETLRKAWKDRFAIVVAGGLGLLHVSHVLGSGLVSRAEPYLARPFDLDELRSLAAPLAARRVALDQATLQTLAALSGGNPALATYGLATIWEAGEASTSLLRDAYTQFLANHGDFVRAIENGVSHRGMVRAPGRVLALVRQRAGALPLAELRNACGGDDPPVDVPQALQLLQAAGLVQVRGLTISDPVEVYPVTSVLNLPALASGGSPNPIETLLDAVAGILAAMHRFGLDFHGKNDLLEEKVFSSVLAVGLAVLGWRSVDREPIQAGGYTDLRARLHHAGSDGHVVFELKIWPHKGYKSIQQQVDDYRLSDTLHCVAVMLGHREIRGWAKRYEAACLSCVAFERLPTPPDLVARWRVKQQDGKQSRYTDHFLVQIPKRGC